MLSQISAIPAPSLNSLGSPDVDSTTANTCTSSPSPPSLQHPWTSGGTQAHLSGEAHKRFVVVTTLLSLIDPVRGEPTTHSLDRHPHDDSWKFEQLQKKFLDSFALISSTSRKGGTTASAVCLEQGHPSGTVLRLARNLGVPDGLVSQLQEVLDDLTAVARRERMPRDQELEILRKVIVLTQDKIWSILEKLCRPEVHASIEKAIRKMEEEETFSGGAEEATFRKWIYNLPLLASLAPQPAPDRLIPHIQWSSQARWTYAERLEIFLESGDGGLPPWLKYIYKLGRYHAATKAMVKLAVKQPTVFTGIHVETVKAPERERFSLGTERTSLLTVLKKITQSDPEELMARLGQTWLTDDPEARLREACRMMLTVHAEMQLLSFYDHNPVLTPRLLFMGTSKKACYLCHEFMSRHPLSIGMSASHQKLYPTWMPAPCSSAVRKKHKVLLWQFSQHLEETTARDLETRLGIRRPVTMDSTAGPSLTTTGTVSTGFWTQELSLQTAVRDKQAGGEAVEYLSVEQADSV